MQANVTMQELERLLYNHTCARCGRRIEVGEPIYMSDDNTFCSKSCRSYARCANCKQLFAVHHQRKSNQGLPMCSDRCVQTASFKSFIASSKGERF